MTNQCQQRNRAGHFHFFGKWGKYEKKKGFDGCKCMDTDSTEADWQLAKYMPAIDDDLKCIVAVRFDRQAYKRLAHLQAEIRARQW